MTIKERRERASHLLALLNSIHKELQYLKESTPSLRIAFNPRVTGSVLNAYREGDCSFEYAASILNPVIS
jgi:hypothetical protein